MPNADIWVTTSLFLAGLALAIWMFWLEKHPRQDLRPRLFPTTLFLFFGGLLALGAGIHLLSFLGIQPPPPRP